MLGIVATIVCSVSLLLNIVGVAIPFWEYASNPSVYYGLWKICVGLNSSAFAPDYTNVCLSLGNVQTIFIIKANHRRLKLGQLHF